jgi:ATP adenylyltransferase
MDYLWSPWRYKYVTEVTSDKESDCFFCAAATGKRDDESLVVFRGKKMFVILNGFPYTSGHVLIAPYAHVAELNLCGSDALLEMMELSQRIETAFHANYKPQGINVGMNLGKAAGAGIAGHLHLHLLPRWFGDTNFMTVTAETRVQPEELKTTYEKLKKALAL